MVTYWRPGGIHVGWGNQEDYDIYLLHPGSSRTLRLTTDAGTDATPAWSPDGRWIAYVHAATDRSRYSLNLVSPLAGPTQTLLTKTITLGSPSWTPDGRTLIVEVGPAPGQPAVLWAVSRTWYTTPAHVTVSGDHRRHRTGSVAGRPDSGLLSQNSLADGGDSSAGSARRCQPRWRAASGHEPGVCRRPHLDTGRQPPPLRSQPGRRRDLATGCGERAREPGPGRTRHGLSAGRTTPRAPAARRSGKYGGAAGRRSRSRSTAECPAYESPQGILYYWRPNPGGNGSLVRRMPEGDEDVALVRAGTPPAIVASEGFYYRAAGTKDVYLYQENAGRWSGCWKTSGSLSRSSRSRPTDDGSPPTSRAGRAST